MDEKDMNKKLDYLINLVESRVVKEEENKGIFVAPTTQILNSSNTSIYLDPEYYYDISIVLVGSVSSDVIVRVDSKIKNNVANTSNLNLNNTNNGYIIKGAKISSIGVLPATIGSVSVYVSYIGYKDYKMPEFRVL